MSPAYYPRKISVNDIQDALADVRALDLELRALIKKFGTDNARYRECAQERSRIVKYATAWSKHELYGDPQLRVGFPRQPGI